MAKAKEESNKVKETDKEKSGIFRWIIEKTLFK